MFTNSNVDKQTFCHSENWQHITWTVLIWQQREWKPTLRTYWKKGSSFSLMFITSNLDKKNFLSLRKLTAYYLLIWHLKRWQLTMSTNPYEIFKMGSSSWSLLFISSKLGKQTLYHSENRQFFTLTTEKISMKMRKAFVFYWSLLIISSNLDKYFFCQSENWQFSLNTWQHTHAKKGFIAYLTLLFNTQQTIRNVDLHIWNISNRKYQNLSELI